MLNTGRLNTKISALTAFKSHISLTLRKTTDQSEKTVMRKEEERGKVKRSSQEGKDMRLRDEKQKLEVKQEEMAAMSWWTYLCGVRSV